MEDYKPVVHRTFSNNKQVRLRFSVCQTFSNFRLEFEYQLFIEKKEECSTENVSQLIRGHIHDVVLERETASELVFGIKRGTSQHIGRLVNALENQQREIGINGYGLSMTTIEEVFLKSVR